MKSVPYTCTRCGYKTKERYRIKDHLYNRKKPCPGTENDIILTDYIKEKILENRIYKVEKNNKQITSSITTNQGYIYLFYTRASKNNDESVYKIGKTKNYLQRQDGYGKGGEMLFVASVSDRHTCENLIKKFFREEFSIRRDYGCEYFQGDVFEMIILIKNTIDKYIEKILVNKIL